jgi:hypothetical protein
MRCPDPDSSRDRWQRAALSGAICCYADPVWGLLWDHGNLALAGRYGVGLEEVEAMFSSGEWIILPHPTRPLQVIMVGPAAEGEAERLIMCIAEVRQTPEGRRFRPIVSRPASASQRNLWQRRRRRGEEQR